MSMLGKFGRFANLRRTKKLRQDHLADHDGRDLIERVDESLAAHRDHKHDHDHGRDQDSELLHDEADELLEERPTEVRRKRRGLFRRNLFRRDPQHEIHDHDEERDIERDDEHGAERDAVRKPRRRSKRGKRASLPIAVLAMAGAALLLLFFLPTIIAHSPLLGRLVASKTADLKGSVTVGSASLGWFSPLVMRRVEVRGADQEPVLQVAELTTESRLLSLLFGGQTGKLRLEQPQLKVVLRDDGSNLEDVLAKYLADQTPQKAPEFTLEISDGGVLVVDASNNRNWQIDKLHVAVEMAGRETSVAKIEASGGVRATPKAGQFQVAGELSRAVAAGIASLPGPWSVQGTVSSDGLPLAMFEPLLRRCAAVTRLDGRLTSKLKGYWKPEGPQRMAVEGTISADGLRASAKPLGSDEIRFERLASVCNVGWSGEQVALRQTSLECEMGHVNLTALIPTKEFSWEKLAAALPRQAGQVQGQVDLAALAKMLPGTLRIRPQTQITAGQLKISGENRADAQGMVWQGQLAASDVKAVNDGQPVAWQQPITVAWNVRETPRGPQIERLRCQSSFLQVEAQGRPDDLSLSGQFDLGQLMTSLEQLVDLGGLKLAGSGEGKLNWKQNEKQEFQAELTARATSFQVRLPSGKAWDEPRLNLTAAAGGRTDFSWKTRLDSGSFSLTAGADKLDVRLTQPIADLSKCDGWPLEIRSAGTTDSWLARIRNRYTVAAWETSGNYDLTVLGTFSKSLVVVEKARAGISEFRLNEPQWRIKVNEPRVELNASGRFDSAARRLEIPRGEFQSTSLAAAIDKLVLNVPEKGSPTATGAVGYQGDLGRLQAWVLGPLALRGWTLGGTFAGQGTLQETGAVIGGALDTTLTNLTLENVNGKRLKEPELRLRVRGDFAPRKGLIELQQCELASTLLGGATAGKVTMQSARTDLDLTGDVQYDLERLSQLLTPYTGEMLRFSGQGKAPTTIRGPLSLAEMQAHSTFNWTSAYAYGFRLGPGALKAELAGGVVRAQPVTLSANDGKVQFTPSLRIAPAPMELAIDPGLVAQQVRLDPTMCSSLLKYAAPALANVAQAEGQFSIQLDSCRIPVASPWASDATGKLILHNGQIGPGPLVMQLAPLFGGVSAARLQKEATVPFMVREGRVHHQSMELAFPELTIRTSGSVGFDQSLALTVEIPLPERLTQNQLAALRGQALQIPIAGSLDRPAIDPRAFAEVQRKLAVGAVQGVIQNGLRDAMQRNNLPVDAQELGNQLNRLLPPRR